MSRPRNSKVELINRLTDLKFNVKLYDPLVPQHLATELKIQMQSELMHASEWGGIIVSLIHECMRDTIEQFVNHRKGTNTIVFDLKSNFQTFESDFSYDKSRNIFRSNTYWSLWNFRRNLINDLTEKNFKITLIGKKDSSYSKFLNENISLHFIADLKFVSSIFFIFYTVALIVWKKPKVVFSFTHLGNISAGLASKFTTFKFVANLSGLGRVYSVGSKKSFLQPFLTFLIKLSMNGASTIFVQNTEDQAWLSNLIPHKANQIKLLPDLAQIWIDLVTVRHSL